MNSDGLLLETELLLLGCFPTKATLPSDSGIKKMADVRMRTGDLGAQLWCGGNGINFDDFANFFVRDGFVAWNVEVGSWFLSDAGQKRVEDLGGLLKEANPTIHARYQQRLAGIQERSRAA